MVNRDGTYKENNVSFNIFLQIGYYSLLLKLGSINSNKYLTN
jgi:hypothetical protein